MKSIALILTTACTLIGVSSCCCQSQSAPPLRPMPNCNPPEVIAKPILVVPTEKAK